MLTRKEKWRIVPWLPPPWNRSPWPLTKDDALKEKKALYYPNPRIESCSVHGPSIITGCDPEDGGPVFGLHGPRFTSTGIWQCCANADANKAYKLARQTGMPLSEGDAESMGLDFFWDELPGRYCGHVGKKTRSGQCYICAENKKAAPKSPRQEAVARGDAWYQPDPDDLCPAGHNAPRRVNNGSCRQCEEDRRASGPGPIWKTSPDLIISRDDARAFGMGVYRTGEPCKRGHNSFRYVSNGGCLVCMGRIADELRAV